MSVRYPPAIITLAILTAYGPVAIMSHTNTRTHNTPCTPLLLLSRVLQVSLHCRVSNTAAIRLYREKLAYRCVARMERYYADAEDAWLMSCTRDDLRLSLLPASDDSSGSSGSSGGAVWK